MPSGASVQIGISAFAKVGIHFDVEWPAMKVRRWDVTCGELTLEAVKALYDASSTRVSERAYPPGTAFPGRTRQGTLYVASGTCVFTSGVEQALSAGDIVDFEAGDYALRVTGPDECRLVYVWDLRPHMN